MKYLRLTAVCAAALSMIACNRSEENISTDGTTEVSISLSADGSHRVKSVAEDVLPDIDDFNVEIFKTTTGARLYRDKYANSSSTRIRLNEGTYKMVAFHGDSLASGFKSAFYQAIVPFEINENDRHINISGTAKLANVKIAVNYGENISSGYSGYYTTVTSDKAGAKGSLNFSATETRAGFLPEGHLKVEVFAPSQNEGKIQHFETYIDAWPNDFITLDIDTKQVTGQLTIGIIIDKETEIIEKEITISSTLVSQDAPVITLSDKLAAGTSTFYEGDELSDHVSIMSNGGFNHAYLDITSDYLAAQGFPARTDLCNMDADTKAKFEAFGIIVLNMTPELRFSAIDFSGMGQKIQYNKSSIFNAAFKLTIEALNGKQAEAEFSFRILKNVATVNINANNAFSRSLRKFTLDIENGKPEKYTLQYRTENGEWTDVPAGTISGNSIAYERISGLEPSTTYQLRACYNNNPDNVTDVVSVTTEGAEQLFDNSFEIWRQETHSFTYNFFGSHHHDLNWYRPGESASSSWWDSNSKKTLAASSTTPNNNWNYRRFPTVGYSKEHTDGDKSVMIYAVNVGNMASDIARGNNTAAGEFFIGSADNSGNRTTYGHAFGCRPDRIVFDYRYIPVDNETFHVDASLAATDGSKIAIFEANNGASANEWATYSISFDWNDVSKKASTIDMCFKSTSASSPATSLNKTITVWENEAQAAHIGSILYIDNIQLIYE